MKDITAVEIVVAPPFTALDAVAEAMHRTPTSRLAAQNLHWERTARSPARSAPRMLRDVGRRS